MAMENNQLENSNIDNDEIEGSIINIVTKFINFFNKKQNNGAFNLQ